MTRALRITATFTAAILATGLLVALYPVAVCLSRRGN